MVNFKLKYEGILTHVVATKESAKKNGVYSDYTKAQLARAAFFRKHIHNWKLADKISRRLSALEIITDPTINGRGTTVNNVRSITSAKGRTASRRWTSRKAA